MKEFSAFKSNSGLVKAIIISGDKIFTGHQDGKVRVWKTWKIVLIMDDGENCTRTTSCLVCNGGAMCNELGFN
ncbi:hypothetical protein KY285_009798 [Solanum tuberosum]|nr:hypothetical protein KY285_009798 [Solanum tuberosum]